MQTAIAAVAVLYFLAYTIAQCGIYLAHDHHGKDIYVSSSTALLQSEEASSPGPVNMGGGSTHLPYEAHGDVAMPRLDNPLRALTLAAVVVMVFLILASATSSPRPPPASPVPVRQGRALLNELCINRC
ncbi:hypothetical protein BFN03_18630 [Rhodococcus sp. WMMA185]|uniref:hypothetical protein n=1 Tax=Rhodococcus sp. WMMA185 TaxID=679318 RepID=UPI0008784F2D|nr:hypothetical protein [Rhodococcus sp. WMMA185]AOW93998.1 hypothetical protein BFN03_18630 [Rhodococcus sp. WMMA185]